MAFRIEQIYQADTLVPGEDNSRKFAEQMEFDGKYLWVLANGAIFIYEFWGESSGNEPTWETLDDLQYPKYAEKLKLISVLFVATGTFTRITTALSLADLPYEEMWAKRNDEYWTKTYPLATPRSATLDPGFIKKCAGKMYVTHTKNFKEILEFDIETQTYVRSISTTEVYVGVTTEFFTSGVTYGTKSNLGVSGAKLWWVGESFGDNAAQRLYSYDPIANVKTTNDIPVRPSLARTTIAPGYNGSVYITNYNNVSVSKFSNATGAYQSSIRMNAQPTMIWTGADRRIWVSSYGSMITLIDADDDQMHNDYAFAEGASNRAVGLGTDPNDGAKMFLVSNTKLLYRHDLNTHEQLEQYIPPQPLEDWHLLTGRIQEPVNMRITYQFSYQDKNLVTRIVRPYLFITQALAPGYFGELFAIRLDPKNYLYRTVYATVNGQGAVTESPLMYFGD